VIGKRLLANKWEVILPAAGGISLNCFLEKEAEPLNRRSQTEPVNEDISGVDRINCPHLLEANETD
jgi:hypothetical protein